MSHQPFETWIFDDQGLSAADRRSLQEHLEVCGSCRKLNNRWQAVHQELRVRQMVAPAPGFTQRWQSSLVERRARAQRRQAWRIIGFLVGAALLLWLVIAGYYLATTSPADWLTALLRTFSSSVGALAVIYSVVQAWVANTPLAINIVLWMMITFTLSALSLSWVLILWRANIVGVNVK